MDVRWNLKSYRACTSRENFGVVEVKLGHTRWIQDEIWKVISCAPHMRTLVVEGTLGHARWMWGKIWKVISPAPCVRTLVWWRGHLVKLDGCKVRFEKSSRMHFTWELCIRCYLFNVPRPNDEDLQDCPLIYLSNVISHGREVTFEKSSHMHLVWELWWGGGDTWSS